MQIFIRILLIFILFCSVFLVKTDFVPHNKIISNSANFISGKTQETLSAIKTEEYFITSSRQNRTEINNQSNKNNDFGVSLGNAVINRLNIFNKFIIYKNKLSFGYVLYRILNNLRNSIYPNAP